MADEKFHENNDSTDFIHLIAPALIAPDAVYNLYWFKNYLHGVRNYFEPISNHNCSLDLFNNL